MKDINYDFFLEGLVKFFDRYNQKTNVKGDYFTQEIKQNSSLKLVYFQSFKKLKTKNQMSLIFIKSSRADLLEKFL